MSCSRGFALCEDLCCCALSGYRRFVGDYPKSSARNCYESAASIERQRHDLRRAPFKRQPNTSYEAVLSNAVFTIDGRLDSEIVETLTNFVCTSGCLVSGIRPTIRIDYILGLSSMTR